ncbi:MAG: DUF6788 family protein [Nitriliruptoraceae bacterium]
MDTDPQLDELHRQRTELYEQLADTDDFRRGSVSETYRRCGKPNCVCVADDHPGHGPRWMWTRKQPGGKTVGRALKEHEVDKVRGEIAAYRQFVEVSGQIVEVNEAICEARGVDPPIESDVQGTAAGDEKGGSSPS